MTTSGICELFGFARPRSRRNGSARTTRGWKMACALFVLCAATAIPSPAQVFRTVANFHDVPDSLPGALSLVQGLDGNFYGTTLEGGSNNAVCSILGCGTVFKVSPGGGLATLYTFCAQPKGVNCPDGSGPWGLILGSDGNFYGTTVAGGPTACEGSTYGCGTVFKISPGGTLTTLHSFCAQTGCPDGSSPNYGVVQASDGNFYGITSGGGAHKGGTVFKITPVGNVTTLHSFCAQKNCPDGQYPGGLIQATDGNLYGTTAGGGNQQCNPPWGCGTLFRITPAGTFTTLHSFNGTDGNYPQTPPVQATDGNFYGITQEGGTLSCLSGLGCGTVFKINPGGALTTLHSFNATDGWAPETLVQAIDGNLYGVTYGSGFECNPSCGGTVFKITLGGTLTTLHNFDLQRDPLDGLSPLLLIQATNGDFYGTTWYGGVYNQGTVFSLCVGLGWFTEELPNYGKVGATIDILGTNLTGASYVTFAGISAPFTVVSKSLIQATVPPGATTGYVRVMLPDGRIPSNKKFRVTPQITSFTPASGPPGTLVTITGVSLSQTWEVTFRTPAAGGVHANFTVVDDQTVTVTVPTGAKTGPIWMGGPGGAATSTTNFTVD